MKLAGQWWSIERVWIDGELGKFGRTFPRHSRIEIDLDQSPGQERETVLHELLHASAAHLPIWDDEDEEERAVRMLTVSVLGMLRENPRLVAYLTEAPA